MTSHQWTENTKPDRPGIWAFKGDDGETRVTSIRDEDERQATWPGAWYRICDLPEIVDPPKWRTPTQADVGRTDVEFSGDQINWTGKDRLHGISPFADVEHKYISGMRWRYARILDDGQPVRKAREWWIQSNRYVYDCLQINGNGKPFPDQIHVREVLNDDSPSNEFWINTYDTYCHMHPSRAEADAKAYTHRVDCFKARRVE